MRCLEVFPGNIEGNRKLKSRALFWRRFWALGTDVRNTAAQRKRDDDPFAFHDSDSEDSDMEHWNFLKTFVFESVSIPSLVVEWFEL